MLQLALLVLALGQAAAVRPVGTPIPADALQRPAALRAEKHVHIRAHQQIKESGGDHVDWSFEAIKQSLLEAHEYDLRLRHPHANHKGVHHDVEPEQNPHGTKLCQKKRYRKTTLKLVKHAPFIGLFNDLMNITRFEGSSVTYAKGAYWVIFDSLRAVGKVSPQFSYLGPDNVLIPEDAGEMESQFEGLQYMPSTDTFLAVRESVDHDTHGLVPLTEEIAIAKDEKSWTLKRVCPVLFDGLEDPNKGWEGLHYFEKDNERYLMGLCESNYCKTIQGDDAPGLERGNGRVILTRLKTEKKWNVETNKEEDTCHWEVVKQIKLPKEAYFLDYAGLAFQPASFGARVGVVSQEDSAVWVGHFNWDDMEFVPGGKVYHFPRNDECEKVFCNVEGLTWIDQHRLMFASDRSKKTQPFWCMEMDQAMHIMALP